ncbi:MAG: GNAT family N-acetyltransferase [Pseudomonadota bacterium]
MTDHPLDRPVLAMLTGRRQRPLALVDGGARRLDPAYGVFAAVDDDAPASLAALARLVRETGDAALVEPFAAPAVAGLAVRSQAACVQMVMERLVPAAAPDFEIVDLTRADAPAMFALATLTRPGPYLARTNELGDFVGVKREGVLVAMAGERMKPDGFTEVSGVCTHPDHRGRGYAAALMRTVMGRIAGRGETPFLHAYADNAVAIGLYETLGFRARRELVMTSLTAG